MQPPCIEPHRESAYERRLIARLQAGDADAMNALFELHVDRVFGYARHLVGNREDAEEVTSETFLRAFERATGFRGDCRFQGWLFTIARNLCADRRRQPRLILLEGDEAEELAVSADDADRLDTSIAVRHALDTLPEDQRLALLLCDVEQWDAREVAASIEKSLPATKSLLYRARRALRDRLTEYWAAE